MKDQRPIYLNLIKIRLPCPALVSILHRASGVLVFLLLPFLLWILQSSLASETQFNDFHQVFEQCGWLRFGLWVVLSAGLYHLVAGIRHMIMDMGKAESLQAGRISSFLVLGISAILIILVGIWLW